MISKNIAEGLKIDSPKLQRFYLRPKLHKEGVPGRPAISSVNCYTCKLSEYVQPILPSTDCQRNSFLCTDKSDFLRKINAVEFVPDNSYLVTLYQPPKV